MSNNIDKYAKVKLGGGNEFIDKGPVEFINKAQLTNMPRLNWGEISVNGQRTRRIHKLGEKCPTTLTNMPRLN